jgi:hypothetical protein
MAMACRIQNTGKHSLYVDLRGGDVLYLPPGGISKALREELLYDNAYLSTWIKQGVVQQIPARMSEILANEKGFSSMESESAFPVDEKHKANQLYEQQDWVVGDTVPEFGIEQIAGIGKKTALKFRKSGIETTTQLLQKCRTAQGRNKTSEEVGVDAKVLAKYTQIADLLRIPGIDPPIAELCVASGIVSPEEISEYDVDSLRERLNLQNNEQVSDKSVPDIKQLEIIIKRARQI